jgi:NTE family protein
LTTTKREYIIYFGYFGKNVEEMPQRQVQGLLTNSLSTRKVGLALSSGAARGLAHIGVLTVLKKHGIRIDMIAGTSMGSLVGALYSSGKDADQIKSLALELGPKRFFYFADPTLPKSGLIRGRKIKDMLISILGDVEFRDMDIPFACSATDIVTGQEIVVKQGSVLEAVMASCSIPLVFAPIKYRGKYLVDGGLVNPVPVSILKDMGADFIIAVTVMPIERDRLPETSVVHTGLKEPNILSIAFQLVNITSYQRLKASLVGADVIIEPQVTHIGWADFHRASECILQGELATQASISEIKRLLAS